MIAGKNEKLFLKKPGVVALILAAVVAAVAVVALVVVAVVAVALGVVGKVWRWAQVISNK